MSKHHSTAELQQIATATAAPVRTRVDRTFGLPSGLYFGTVGLYLAFLGLLTSAFHNPELILPMTVIVGSIIFGFGVNRTWAAMKPQNDSKPATWGQFASSGVQTLSGHLTAAEASIQVLMLPVLIFFWGLSVAIIAAVVR